MKKATTKAEVKKLSAKEIKAITAGAGGRFQARDVRYCNCT